MKLRWSLLVMLVAIGCGGPPARKHQPPRRAEAGEPTTPSAAGDGHGVRRRGGEPRDAGAIEIDAAVEAGPDLDDAAHGEGEAAERRPVMGVERVRLFEWKPLAADVGDDELAFDAIGFTPPHRGARYLVADLQGVLGPARVRKVVTVRHDHQRCDGTTRYFVARFESPPARETTGRELIAVGPLAHLPSPDRTRILSDVTPPPGMDRTPRDLDVAVSLGGDDTPDLAVVSRAGTCKGDPPAERLRTPPGRPTFTPVGEHCEERWARTASGWKPLARLFIRRCAHETPDFGR